MNQNETKFKDDILKGKIGEQIFKNDFLEFLNIKYQDVTNCQKFQVMDSDFITKIGLYEIKANYKDDKKLFIEEYTNINENLGKISKGWFYKTKADLIIFVSKTTRTMVFLPFTEKFKNFYEKEIVETEKFKLYKNKISIYNNSKWQSAFRIIELSFLSGYYSMYKKL